MSDLESREDREIRECLQKAYGYSDEQLLRKLEDAEDSLKETDFPGAEKRIFQKLMERKAAEEAAQNDKGEGNEEDRGNEKLPAVVEIRKTDIEDTEVDAPAGPKKKSVLSGRRKLFLSAALVAVFMIALGITAIGGRNYFFRNRRSNFDTVILNNNKNKQESSQLEEAYLIIEEELKLPSMRLGYVPESLIYQEINWKKNSATIRFTYEEKSIILYENKGLESSSAGIKSDRKDGKNVYNEWLGQDIIYFENMLDNGDVEYETTIVVGDNVYYFSGIMPEEEYINIIKNFYL